MMNELTEKQKGEFFELPVEMGIFVPSTKDASVPVSDSEFESRVRQVEDFVAKLFGGFSSFDDIQGGYYSDDLKEVIREEVKEVRFFANAGAFQENIKGLLNQITLWCLEWGQEAIGFEIEGDLFYVGANSKIYRYGGETYANGGVTLSHVDVSMAPMGERTQVGSEGDTYLGGNAFVYKKGGMVDYSRKMIESQNKEVAHHSDELKSILDKYKKMSVEPWVIAKMERATTDLSDVTHYLDGKEGKNYYAQGGELSNKIKKGEKLFNRKGYWKRRGIYSEDDVFYFYMNKGWFTKNPDGTYKANPVFVEQAMTSYYSDGTPFHVYPHSKKDANSLTADEVLSKLPDLYESEEMPIYRWRDMFDDGEFVPIELAYRVGFYLKYKRNENNQIETTDELIKFKESFEELGFTCDIVSRKSWTTLYELKNLRPSIVPVSDLRIDNPDWQLNKRNFSKQRYNFQMKYFVPRSVKLILNRADKKFGIYADLSDAKRLEYESFVKNQVNALGYSYDSFDVINGKMMIKSIYLTNYGEYFEDGYQDNMYNYIYSVWSDSMIDPDEMIDFAYESKELAKGGDIPVKIVNKGKTYNKSNYKAIYGDFDKDGLMNSDDPNPIKKGDKRRVEQLSFPKIFDNLLDTKDKLDSTMYDAVDTLKKITPDGGKIYARTKTPYSIINKLIDSRMIVSKDPKKGLTDMVGTTIVVDSVDDVMRVQKEIESGALGEIVPEGYDKNGNVILADDKYKNPKGGYRAIHYIIMMDGIPVEVQLKTKRMKEINELAHPHYKAKNLNSDYMNYLTDLADKGDRGDVKAQREFNSIMRNKKNVSEKLKLDSTYMYAMGGRVEEIYGDEMDLDGIFEDFKED